MKASFFRALLRDVKTTICLPEPLYRSAQQLARANGMSVAQFIADLIGRVLPGNEEPEPLEDFADWRGELLS